MGGKKPYQCKVPGCSKVYVSFQGFKEHRKEHGAILFPCNEPGCGRSFRWRSGLWSHKKAHHRKHAMQTTSSSCSHESSPPSSPIVSVGYWGQRQSLELVHGDDVRGDGLFLFSCDNLAPKLPSSWDEGGLLDGMLVA